MNDVVMKPIVKHVTEGNAPIWRKPMLTTPFFECYEPLIETRAFRMWGGYNTLTYFSSIEHEYFAIRNTTSVFDLTPMVKYDIRGPGAEDFLSRLLTRDVRKLKKNRVTYTMWCDDDGNVIDDGTVFKLGKDKYRLCTAERQLDWFLDSAIGFDVSIREITAEIAALALQGPTSCATLKHLGFAGIENLKPFEIGHYNELGYEVMVSRTGFTGDLGYELWLTGVASAWRHAGHGRALLRALLATPAGRLAWIVRVQHRSESSAAIVPSMDASSARAASSREVFLESDALDTVCSLDGAAAAALSSFLYSELS